jgi:hypothetical protein
VNAVQRRGQEDGLHQDVLGDEPKPERAPDPRMDAIFVTFFVIPFIANRMICSKADRALTRRDMAGWAEEDRVFSDYPQCVNDARTKTSGAGI